MNLPQSMIKILPRIHDSTDDNRRRKIRQCFLPFILQISSHIDHDWYRKGLSPFIQHIGKYPKICSQQDIIYRHLIVSTVFPKLEVPALGETFGQQKGEYVLLCTHRKDNITFLIIIPIIAQQNPYSVPKMNIINLRQSMSRKANCWDNAPQESFFGHMKDEIDISWCTTYDEIQQVIADWTCYYNNERYQWNLTKLAPTVTTVISLLVSIHYLSLEQKERINLGTLFCQKLLLAVNIGIYY